MPDYMNERFFNIQLWTLLSQIRQSKFFVVVFQLNSNQSSLIFNQIIIDQPLYPLYKLFFLPVFNPQSNYRIFDQVIQNTSAMGNFQNANNQQYDEGAFNQLKISVDFQKPVVIQLKPLLHWSLQQIRQIYAPFRQRKGSPLLTRSQFLRLMCLSRVQSFNLYDRMCRKHSINVFEIVSILVLTSYTSYAYKIHFLFNVFDLDSSKGLQFRELILSFKSLIRGFCVLTDQPLPDNYLLQKYAQVMFSRADLNNDQCLQLGEVLSWFQGNKQGLDLFTRFQPNEVIPKEDYQIFSIFQSYSEPQITMTYHRIEKQYKKKPLDSTDYELLTIHQQSAFLKSQTKLESMRKSKNKSFKLRESNFKTSRTNFCHFGQDNCDKEKKVGFNVLTSRVSKQKDHNLFPTFVREASITQEEDQCQFKQNILNTRKEQTQSRLKKTGSNQILNSVSKFSSRQSHQIENSLKRTKSSMLNSIKEKIPFKQTSNTTQKNLLKSLRAWNYISTAQNSWEGTKIDLATIKQIRERGGKRKFQNIIILKGRSITKRQIFNLRDYFENLSGGRKFILIENFMDSFNEQKYNHMKSVAASLFNFLDADQNGKVTFKQLIYKLYPDLSPEHFSIIKIWNNQYNQSFNISKKVKTHREQDQIKKRILPKTCITRYREMFDFFDKGKKGYVDLQDLRRVLSDVSTDKEILTVLEDNDKNKDGRLDLREFMHVLLPIDLDIQGV